ncbi:MAG: TrmH family RNA methyltransferase [Ginsengibacter sp.]
MLSKKIVKYIQSLSHKKFRDEENAFIAEGPKIITEFLMSEKMKCKLICAEKKWLSDNHFLLKNIGIENIFEADDHWLKSISLLKTPNKVVAVFNKIAANEKQNFAGKISLMLDDLQDPGNLGTIIRIADWFGIENIICSKNSVDCYNPKVVQSTMGSLLRVNILYTDLESFVDKNKRIPIYAADLSGISLYKLPKINEGIFLIGNESNGLSEEILKSASQKITIPKAGHAESLNAAVATGIILSQVVFHP